MQPMEPLPDNVLPLPGLEDPRRNHLAPVRRDDPDTSHHAKLDAYPRSGTRKRRALQAYWRQHHQHPTLWGLTDWELSVVLDCLRGSASKIRGKLAEDGWVADTGHRRATDTGSKAAVWALTPLAARYLSRLHLGGQL